jgi:hypothetical protein
MSLSAIITPFFRRNYNLTIGHFYFGVLGHSHFGGTARFYGPLIHHYLLSCDSIGNTDR